MPAFNFKEQFVPAIIDGTKGGTIRAYRTNKMKVGDIMYLYVGLRTRQTRKLGQHTCVELFDVIVMDYGILFRGPDIQFEINAEQLDQFAKSDGFGSWDEMKTFFEMPFHGFCARWIPLKDQVNITY